MADSERIRIGGIKFSEQLVHVTIVCRSADDTTFHELLHLLAGREINISFLCHSTVTSRPRSSFCVDQAELGRVRQLLSFFSLQNINVDITPSVGTLTLFPHRNSLRLLGLLLEFFGRNRFPVFSFGTSISAIALNTRYLLLDEIAEKLQATFELPENHAPFRQEFRVEQPPR